MAKKKPKPNLILEELFLVKADWSRTFFGVIRRGEDEFGNPVVMGKVIINEGMAWCLAREDGELRKFMDGICTLKLDYNINGCSGVFTTIDVMKYYSN